MKRTLLLIIFLISCFTVAETMGQTAQSVPGPVISCPPGAHTGHSRVPMPKYIRDKMNAAVDSRDTEEACSQIIVNYNGFSLEAEAAFEYAKTIWENALVSDVPIIIDATWIDLGENTLGSAGPSTLLFDFAGAPDDRMYATPLANAIAGSDLTFGGPHINASFNSEFTWYFGTDGNPPGDLFDFVSVVLHEIGHGLGFTAIREYDEDTGVGSMGFGNPVLFSRYSENILLGEGGTPVITLGDGTALGSAFTSDNLYSGSAAATLANGGSAPRYYAPAEYSTSSVAHWDESDFPNGNVHSLMTPQIGPGEAVHNPGPITLGLFEDMGWVLCESLEDQPCTEWQSPEPDAGWPDFNTFFGGAPCDDGSGCPVNEIQEFQVYAGEAYAVNNFIEGGTYTFSMCNGPGAGTWEPDFTIIAPSGEVDAFGTTTPCSITWTASESGTYLIVINEADNCGAFAEVNNGWPALTCSGGGVECIDTGCETSSVMLDGPDVICPDQSTTVFLPEPASIPDGGGIRLQFINTTTSTGINLTLGGGLPYTFDSDLNGLLSANDFDLFEGEYTINIFIFTDANNIAGTICASGSDPVTVTFLAEDDPLCDDTGVNCSASTLIPDGPTDICEGETTTLTGAVPPEIPVGGGMLYQFVNVDTDDALNWTNAPFPATFDNDLNGLLSANDIDPFSGTYEVNIYVFTNPADVAGSICASGDTPVVLTFLDADDPLCQDPGENCAVSSLIVDGPVDICAGETTTLSGAVPPEVPAGGGFLYQFVNVDTDAAVNWQGAPFPATFDNDLNGLLSANDLDPFSGTYQVEIYVFTDPEDIAGSLCADGNAPVVLTFLDADDPLCQETNDPCTVSDLIIIGPALACEGESITLGTLFPPQVPTGGGVALIFTESGTADFYILTDVELPYTFDAGLNGSLATDGFDPFSGDYEVEIIVYTNPDNVIGSICAEGLTLAEITFATAGHPDCAGPDEPCTEWVDPTPITGYEVFNALFGGAPCDDGGGCAFNEVTTIEAWGGEAYSVENFVEGGSYTFSICNGPGAGTWIPDFTIIAPSGEVDAFGSDTDCSITWTASESGTYLIVVNELGDCGGLLEVNNGFPALTCEGSSETACPEACEAGTIVAEGDTELCPGSVVSVFNPVEVSVPSEGGYLLRALAGADVYDFEGIDPSDFLEINNTLSGLLSEPFIGEMTLTGIVFEDASDIDGTVCDETGELVLTFLSEDDEECTVGTYDAGAVPAWELFPNPAADGFTVGLTLTNPETLTVRVIDISGRTVSSENLPAASGRRELTVPANEFAPGMYAVTLEGVHFRDTKRLVISR